MACTITGFKTDHSGNYINKDPDAYLDYSVDWSDWLVGNDTIASSAWTISTVSGDTAPLATDNDLSTTTKATIWLSGGTTGYIYTVTNEITTASGLIDDRSFRIFVREK